MTSMTKIDRELVGRPIDVPQVSWGPRDVITYALGVGAGQRDPHCELELTTEGTLRVLPTFGAVITHAIVRAAVEFGAPEAMIHAEQALDVPGSLPVSGTARLTGRVASVHDKTSGALVVIEGAAYDTRSGEALVRSRSSIFVRGAGGFGGDRGAPAQAVVPPDRAPDQELTASVPSNQALLYRLSGDDNPLHVDPVAARKAGFERPILHGLCTYGYAGRLLLHAFCGGEPARMRSIAVRFVAPLMPGDTMTVRAWEEDERVVFRVLTAGERVVLDRGVVVRTPV